MPWPARRGTVAQHGPNDQHRSAERVVGFVTSIEGAARVSIDEKTDSTNDRRQRIVEIAAALFDKNGYHATTTGEIAAASGIAKPTLYHYFQSKDEILFCIHEQFVDGLLQKYEAGAASDTSPRDTLLEFMADLLEIIGSERGHVRVFFEHHRELSEPARAQIKSKRRQLYSVVERVLADGVEAKQFRDVNPRLTMLAMFGMCNWCYQWFRSSGDLSSEEIAQYFGQLFLEGIALPSGG